MSISGHQEYPLEEYLQKLKDKNIDENFCPIPFTSLILHPTGDIGCCREKGTEHVMGNIKNQTIEEIWNGVEIRQWRREFLTGNIKTCKNEIQNKSCHRLYLNRRLFYYLKEDPQEYMKGPILRLSPDLNGKCNLQCPFCFVWKMPNGKYDEIPGFWDYLKTNVFPYVVQVDPLGGEPFIQQDLYKTIDIISEVNPTTLWSFTTNGHWKFSHYIKEKLDKIQIHTISFSIDSIDEQVYPIVRKGGKLDTVLKNLDDIIHYDEYRKRSGNGFMIILNATFQKENWKEVGPIIRFAKKKDIYPFIQFVFEPEEMSLLSCPLIEQEKILNYYLNNLNAEEILIAHRIIRPLMNNLSPLIKGKVLKLCDALTEGRFGRL